VTAVAKVDARSLRGALEAGGEIGLVDVREERPFGNGHLLTACNIPLGLLELELPHRAPCRVVKLVLCDGGDGLAGRAANVAAGLGYRDVAILDGGVPAWRAAGYEVFTGLNVPGKAFGEVVDETCAPPHLMAAEVKARVDAGADLVILDSRPWDEYVDFNIPGGIDCPGAELAYRVRDLAPDPSTTVVVNCAGRTRSIVGCQSLVNAGVPNPVYALLNGTIGWEQAGFTLEHDASRRYGEVSQKALAWSLGAARRLAERCGVATIDRSTLRVWQSESDRQTLYLLDVRSPEEYDAGHLPGSLSAPGGQLVQGADDWIAVRDGRIVLIDDTGVRAAMTASWLKQLLHRHVAVLEGGLDAERLEIGPAPSPFAMPGAASMSAADLAALKDEATVLDLSHSQTFRAGHVPGARWALRSRLADFVADLPANRPVAVMDDRDDFLAALAVGDLQALGRPDAVVLRGALAGWRGAGGDTVTGLDGMLTAMDDCYHLPADLIDDPEQADRDYLAWEATLVAHVARDGLLDYRPLR
jgi:rhodanese-related sulfurtransferase